MPKLKWRPAECISRRVSRCFIGCVMMKNPRGKMLPANRKVSANCTPRLCTNQTFPVHFFKVQQFYTILLKPKEQQKNIEPIGGSSSNGPLANHTTFNVTPTDATILLTMV
jgi:hypothetical protein